MTMKVALLSVTLLCSLTACTAGYAAIQPCPPSNTTCYFELTIEHKLSMMHGNELVKPSDGRLAYIDGTLLAEEAAKEVIQGDGYHLNTRMLIVANGQMPGPTLDVTEGQELVITVKNRLYSDGLTMHWHGVVQQDTNLMDGVAFVNQCPIPPGLDFTYRFKVISSGSDFYHAHIGAQRTMGLFGPLIERSKPGSTTDKSDPIVDREYSMTLNDWNHNYDSVVAHLKIGGLYDVGSTEKASKYKAPDNSSYPDFIWHSGLINGKGRFYDPDTLSHNGAPLTVFDISPGEKVRFRAVGAGTLFPMRVSIDNHQLIMISSDGYRFADTPVQSFIISPGERSDFIINGDQEPGCYWIRAETLEVGVNHSAEAILQYTTNPLETTDYDNYERNRCFLPWFDNQKPCSATNVCKVLNCPFERYADSYHIDCVHLHELISLEMKYDTTVDHTKEFEKDAFFNFAFVFPNLAINGRHWVQPSVSASAQSNELKADYCTDPSCSSSVQGCSCTNYMNLTRDKQYQFIFTSLGSGIAPAHPIHLHGHGYQVMYQGFAPLDSITGGPVNRYINEDIECIGSTAETQADSPCTQLQWASEDRRNAIMANFSKTPVKKDTIVIPTGGYAVVRFKASNPGFWYMHCHIELHNLGGMAMMFNEAPGTREEILENIDSPRSFPRCRNYPTTFPETDDSEDKKSEVRDSTTSTTSGAESVLAATLRLIIPFATVLYFW